MTKKYLLIVFAVFSFFLFSCSSVQTAEVFEIQGDVGVRRSVSDREIPAFKGMKLERKDRIRTGAESKAVIRLTSEIRAILAADSDVSIEEISLSDSDINAVFTLEKGGIGNIVDRVLSPESKYEIKTPTAVLGIRGTEFYVQLEKGKVKVWLAKGRIEMQYRTKDGVLSQYTDSDGESQSMVLDSPSTFSFPVIGEKVDPKSTEFNPDGLFPEFRDSPVIEELTDDKLVFAREYLNESPTDPEFDSSLQYDYVDASGSIMWRDSNQWTMIGPINENDIRTHGEIRFEDGLLVTSSDRKVYRYINNIGEPMFELDQFVRFKEGVAIYNLDTSLNPNKDSFSKLINRRGEVISDITQNGYFLSGYESIELEKMRKNFRVFSPLPQDRIRLFHDNRTGKIGAVDLAGKELIPPNFNGIYQFNEGLAVFREGDKYGYIDSKGTVVIEPVYQYASMFDNGVAKVSMDAVYSYDNGPLVNIEGNFFYIDYEGKRLEEKDLRVTGQGSMIPYNQMKTTKIRDIGYGCADDALFLIKVNGLFGYQDKSGNIVIEPQFAEAAHFSEGLAAVKVKAEDPFGFINRKGEMVIEPAFAGIEQFQHGVCVIGIAVGNPEDSDPTIRYGLIDRNGNAILEANYSSLHLVDYSTREIEDRETLERFLSNHPSGKTFLVLTYGSDGRRRMLLNVSGGR
ncbi:MAG: WG repeat-containing protein [Bacillota bacterium]|nr:WG repeat-containing protein [Bacillota bacterium]